MSSARRTLSAFAAAAAVAKVNAAMGSAFSTGPTASDTFIRESWATLVLPAVPSDNNGDLSLWVGMGTSAGDLIQSIAENYDSDAWSVYAYTLMETSDTTQMPVQTTGTDAAEGDHVTMHYEYNDSTGNYTQTVLLNGDVVATLSTSDGKAEGWGSSVECADETCGTVASHKWINCSIILDSADTAYSDTLALGTGVDATMTSDDGITWTIGTISIPGWDFSTESVVDSDSSSTTTSSAASASSTGGYSSSSASYDASGASPSGSFGSSTGSSSGASPSGSFGSSTDSSSGASPSGFSSGSSTDSSSGASASGSPSFGGSSTGSSSDASPSGSFGSSTGSSSGAYPSGASFGSGSEQGPSGTDGADAQPTGTWGSSGASASGGAQSWWGGSSSSGSEGWRRSRIMRHKQ